MIDTIVAQFEVPPNTQPGDNWESTTTTHGLAIRHRFSITASTVRLATYQHRDSRTRMRIEVSLPKLLLGHNIQLLTAAQVRDAGVMLQREVERLAPIVTVPSVDSWGLAEVHWCHAWRVASPGAVISALAATAPQTKAQRTTREDDGRGGQTFRRQPKSLRGEWSEQLYDKGAETMALLARGKIDLGRWGLSAEQIAEMARGVLRYEVVTRRKALRGILGPGPTVAQLYDHLDANGSAFILSKWDLLSAHCVPTLTADAARTLCATYPACTAVDLFNFWFALNNLGVPEYRRLTNISPEKWRRQVTRLKEAGLGLGQPGHAAHPIVPPFGG